jgi:thioredoxin reductase (NADPH)
MRLTLLSRAWCHLCDEMLDALRPIAAIHEAQVTVLDVDLPDHAALEALWGDEVPVLFAGDPEARNELCRHRLDAARVTAALGSVD